MIKYIRRYPETYKRFCGWVYTNYGHTPAYLEFTRADVTYRLLREFFGVKAIVPPHLTAEELLYDDSKPILQKYEFQITGGRKAEPIIAEPYRPKVNITEQQEKKPITMYFGSWTALKAKMFESIMETDPGPAPF